MREFEHNGIKQQNRNGLLEKDPTVDGLKTGHTDSAGFCLVTSALRDGMRLVSVVMGSTSMKARENASGALLNYGFTFYDTKLGSQGRHGARQRARVEGGRAPRPNLGIKDDLYITLPRGEQRTSKPRWTFSRGSIAPLLKDATVGTLRVLSGGQTLATLPLHPLQGGGRRRLVAAPDRHHSICGS